MPRFLIDQSKAMRTAEEKQAEQVHIQDCPTLYVPAPLRRITVEMGCTRRFADEQK